MIYPSIDGMLKKVDSRYSLVIMVSKRARQLREKYADREEVNKYKEVTTALEDVSSGRITYERIKDGVK